MKKLGLQSTWGQALFSFLLPIFLILGVRWALFEPFVIPSSSMVPNLLVHDHILVLKSSMGLRLPFSDHWLAHWSMPKRGDVIVFKFPENPNIYYIKRLIGLPGDKIEVQNGRISVNGEDWKTSEVEKQAGDEPGFTYFNETSGHEGTDSKTHRIRFLQGSAATGEKKSYEVPPEHFFFMGDNRDQSSDGRVWGFVPERYLSGHAWLIWLSCENTLASASYICDFSTLRPSRMFHTVR